MDASSWKSPHLFPAEGDEPKTESQSLSLSFVHTKLALVRSANVEPLTAAELTDRQKPSKPSLKMRSLSLTKLADTVQSSRIAAVVQNSPLLVWTPHPATVAT